MESTKPASTVDLIVPCQGGIILIKRKYDPFKDYWALPGGYIECSKESLEETAVRELQEETELITNPLEIRLVGVYSDPKRDPRGHVITHVYEVKNYTGTPHANDDASEIIISKNLPDRLAFDHKKILEDYFRSKDVGI